MLSVSGLKVTIDVDMTDEQDLENFDPEEPEVEEQRIYCSCQSEYCDCGSDLGITEATARNVYNHLGFSEGRSAVQAKGYRETALHIWGTHNLSTDDVLSWLADYKPLDIEWINDASCNVVFSNPNTVLRVIFDCAEPFDRRVALAAAAALAALLQKEDENESEAHSLRASSVNEDKSLTENDLLTTADSDPPSLHLSLETLDSVEEFSQYLPPSGRWFKALSVPAKTISLFLRFAHSTDVKLPGAERRSMYYRRYGNPNYGGMTGILSRSYRRRLRGLKKTTDSLDGDSSNPRLLTRDLIEEITRAYENPDAGSVAPHTARKTKPRAAFVNPDATGPAPNRQLVVYDNVYDGDDEEKPVGAGISDGLRARIGTRREAVDFPTPKSPKQPRKWPRKDRGPPPNRWLTDDYSFSPPSLENINVIDLREPWMREEDALSYSAHKPFVFSGKKTTNRRVKEDELNGTTTITLLPDVEPPLSPSDPQEDDNSSRTRRLLTSMSMVADMEERSSNSRPISSRLGYRKNQPPQHRARDVWQRLG